MDQTTEEHVPVLIAGGGPVGLTLAALLSRQGIRSQVIEADEGYCTGSRAICISRRSQEILGWVGADAPLVAKGLGWKDKIAAGFTNSGSRSGDKLSTLMQMALFAAQHGMHWVNLALPPGNCSSTGSEEDLNRLGFWLGAAAQSNTDQGADLVPPEADLATARHLGERVAHTTLQFVRGRVH